MLKGSVNMPKLPKLTVQQLQKIGTAPTFYSALEDHELDQEFIDYRHALESNRLEASQDDRELYVEHDENEYAVRPQRDEAALAGRAWPTTLLYRYLVPPIRDTFLELSQGRRVATNLLKLLAATLMISGVILACFYFPPLVGFFAVHGLTSAVGIGMIGSLATAAIYIGNELIKAIESVSRKLGVHHYENYGSQLNFWKKNYNNSEDTLQIMNAYLVNKRDSAKNQDLKTMITRLIEKFEISKKQDVHSVGLFFAEELKILLKTRSNLQHIPAGTLDKANTPAEVNARLQEIKIQLDADIATITQVIEKLRKAPGITIATKSALDKAYANITKQQWTDEVNEQFKHLGNLMGESQVRPEVKSVQSAELAASAEPATGAVPKEFDDSYKMAHKKLSNLEVEDGNIVLLTKGKKVILDKQEDYPQVIEWIRKMDAYKEHVQPPPAALQEAEVQRLDKLKAVLLPKPK